MATVEISENNLLNKKESPFANVPLCLMLIVALLIVLYMYFFSFIQVSGTSMQNTLQQGQYVFFVEHNYTIERGDIVTVDDKIEDKLLIKRVIGLEGDKILFMKSADANKFVDLYICQNGRNRFTLVDEPYIAERMRCDGNFKDLWKYTKVAEYYSLVTEINVNDPEVGLQQAIMDNYCIEIPENGIFFLGDNRNYSGDSREDKKSKLTLSDVKGKALKIIDQNSAFDKILGFLY